MELGNWSSGDRLDRERKYGESSACKSEKTRDSPGKQGKSQLSAYKSFEEKRIQTRKPRGGAQGEGGDPGECCILEGKRRKVAKGRGSNPECHMLLVGPV